jgi:hypothetical protein
MSEPVKEYGRIKLESVKKALIANNFDAYVAEDAEGAGRIVLEDIVPTLEGGVVSWGGSITLKECHIKRWFHESADWDVISVDEPGLDPDEKLNRRRQALLSDLYFLGTNAVTEDGNSGESGYDRQSGRRPHLRSEESCRSCGPK